MSSSDRNSKAVESDAPYIVLLNEADNSRRRDTHHDDSDGNSYISFQSKKGILIGISLIVMAGIVSASVVSKRTSIISYSLDRFERMAIDDNEQFRTSTQKIANKTEEEKGSRSYLSKATTDEDFIHSYTNGKLLSTQEIRDILQSLRRSLSKANTDSSFIRSLDNSESNKNSTTGHSADNKNQNELDTIDMNMFQDLIAQSVTDEKQRSKENNDNVIDRELLHEVMLENISRKIKLRNENCDEEGKSTQVHVDKQREVTIENIVESSSRTDNEVNTSLNLQDAASEEGVNQVDIEMSKNRQNVEDDYYRKFIGIDRSRKSKQRETTKRMVDESSTPEEKMAHDMIQWSLKKETAIHQKRHQNVLDSESETVVEDKIAHDMVQWSLKKESTIRKKRNALAYAITTATTNSEISDPTEEEKMAKEMERWSMKKETDIRRKHTFDNKVSSTTDELKIADDMVRWSLKKETTIHNERRAKKKKNDIGSNGKSTSSLSEEEKMANEMLHWSLQKESDIRRNNLFSSSTLPLTDGTNLTNETEQTSIQ